MWYILNLQTDVGTCKGFNMGFVSLDKVLMVIKSSPLHLSIKKNNFFNICDVLLAFLFRD